MSLSSEQLNNFVTKKGLKFFNNNYPVTKDSFGLPSQIEPKYITRLIDPQNNICSLIQSIDRENVRKCIAEDLRRVMFFTKEESIQISEYYVEKKYNEYKEYVMGL